VKLSWCGWDWGRLVCQTSFFLSSTSTLEGATTLCITTFSITALSIIAFSIKINKTRHSYAQHNGRLLFCWLLFMPYVLYAKCRKIDLYAECHYAECLYVECHCAEWREPPRISLGLAYKPFIVVSSTGSLSTYYSRRNDTQRHSA
jgi:hypothetical protein